MAIVNNGTVNAISSDKLPSGYTPPVVTTFTDWEWTRVLTLSVLKATVENASASTTMANIISNGTVGVTKQVLDIVNADYLTTPSVTFFAVINSLTTTMEPNYVTFKHLTNAVTAYEVNVTIYLKAV